MADWATIQQQIESASTPGESAGGYDAVRREKLRALESVTNNPVVLYATDFTNQIKSFVAQQMGASTNIDLRDKDGFYEVTKDLPSGPLEVVLHSPGGSAEATESIVAILRPKFSPIRFIIPSIAKSAATMLALSGDRIAMDELGELGPIDPQMVFNRNGQVVVAPVQSIVEEFRLAQDEVGRDTSKLPGWMPILQQYGPSLLIECDKHIQLAKSLVTEWLVAYMFANDSEGPEKAARITEFLSDDKNFYSHSRRIGIERLKPLEVALDDLRDDYYRAMREAVHELHIATTLTLASTGAFKLYENSRGKALVSAVQATTPSQAPSDAAPTTPDIEPTGPPFNRQQRRAQQRKHS